MHTSRSMFFPTFLFLLVMSMIVTAPTFAASVGNPDTLGKSGAVSLSLEHDLSSVNMELKNGRVSEGTFTEDFGASKMSLKAKTTYVVGTFGILENVDAFVGLGVNNAKLGFDMNYPGGSDAVEIKDGSNLAWKAGVRAKIAEVAGVKLGAMAQCSAYKMDGKFMINGQDLGEALSASYHTDTEVRSWQAAVTGSKQMGRFNPYAGITYMKARAKSHTSVNGDGYSAAVDITAKNENSVGVVVGTGIEVMENLSANIEGRLINEKAGTLSLSYAF